MNFLDKLNPEQREAVLHRDGPAAHPRGRGLGEDARHHVSASRTSSATATPSPGEVLAVTFTNKAAQEMRERVEALIGVGGRGRVALDVPLALRAAAPARGAEDRAVARLRHLRLVRPGRGRQAGRSASSASTTSSSRRAWRCRASARPRTGWKGPSRCAAPGTSATSRSRRSTSATSRRSRTPTRSTSTISCSRRSSSSRRPSRRASSTRRSSST